MQVNILGTPYEITVTKYDEDEAFERLSIGGYCDSYIKKIVVCDMTTYKGWENEPKETCEAAQKQTLRHEIVHAFLNESGLADNAGVYDNPWAKNEEMVDWIAIQGFKIFRAWVEADALFNTPIVATPTCEEIGEKLLEKLKNTPIDIVKD